MASAQLLCKLAQVLCTFSLSFLHNNFYASLHKSCAWGAQKNRFLFFLCPLRSISSPSELWRELKRVIPTLIRAIPLNCCLFVLASSGSEQSLVIPKPKTPSQLPWPLEIWPEMLVTPWPLIIKLVLQRLLQSLKYFCGFISRYYEAIETQYTRIVLILRESGRECKTVFIMESWKVAFSFLAFLPFCC